MADQDKTDNDKQYKADRTVDEVQRFFDPTHRGPQLVFHNSTKNHSQDNRHNGQIQSFADVAKDPEYCGDNAVGERVAERIDPNE